jgi:ABC-2 type transport system permease protein
VNSVWSIALKDLRILRRDRSALVFLFGFPLIFTAIFGAIYGGADRQKSSGIKVLVVNQDRGAHGAELIEAMGKLGLAVEEENSPEALKKRVTSGEQPLGLIIPATYSEELEAEVKAQAAGAQKAAQAKIIRIVDPAQITVAGIAEGAVAGAVQRAVGLLYRKAKLDRIPPEYRADAERSASIGTGRSPVAFETIETEKRPKLTPGDLFIPGFVVYFVFSMANGVAATILYERNEGTLRRMLSAPITRGQILIGKMLARGIIGLLQTVVLFAIGKVMLHLTLSASDLPAVTIIAVATVLASTGLGMLIATLGKTMEQIQGMTTMALVVMGFISGTLIPRTFLPPALQQLSYITPHAWALTAYQDVMLRHLSLTATLGNLAMVFVFAGVFYAIALARFKFEV